MRQTKYAVALTKSDRADLRTRIGRGHAPARLLTNARILLKADQGEGGPGWSDVAIAGAVEVHPATGSRVRRRFVEYGLDAALNRNAPARTYSQRLDGAADAHPVALACGEPPGGHERWMLADAADRSY